MPFPFSCLKKHKKRERDQMSASKTEEFGPELTDFLVAGLFQPLKAPANPLGLACMRQDNPCIEDIFNFERRIGKGGFSEVWAAKYIQKPKEDPVAVKLMEKRKVNSTLVVNEMSVLKVLHNCLFTAQMVSNFQTHTHFAIVMKYATGGTLNDRVKIIRRFSELVARFYAAEIAEGLFLLHNKGIIHRDLTLDNVLINDSGHVLLSDFGLSLLRDPLEWNNVCPPWRDADKPQLPAPELLLGAEYDKTVDWWSYGLILYRMVVGEYPFMKDVMRQTRENYSLEMTCYPEYYPSFLSPQIKVMLEKLFARKRTLRLGRGPMEENDVTNMEFFHNVDWCHVRDQTLPVPFHDMVPYGQARGRKHISLPFSRIRDIKSTSTSKM